MSLGVPRPCCQCTYRTCWCPSLVYRCPPIVIFECKKRHADILYKNRHIENTLILLFQHSRMYRARKVSLYYHGDKCAEFWPYSLQIRIRIPNTSLGWKSGLLKFDLWFLNITIMRKWYAFNRNYTLNIESWHFGE